MEDLSAWLKKRRLDRYGLLFQKKNVDFPTLLRLSDAQLEQMGLPARDVAKLRAAIDHHSSGGTDRSKRGQREAERRHITIMFCDLVDSTPLSHEVDPEELRNIMKAYQEVCGEIIKNYYGHIDQFLGDGIKAYFGWPIAREDDSERAVWVGLKIVEAVKKLSFSVRVGISTRKLSLSVRVGISTGEVVISDSGNGDPSLPGGAIGETPHRASRLQAIAEPNSVVLEKPTQLILERFNLQHFGHHNLKGIVEPVEVFRVNGVREHSIRFLSQSTGLTPLVGRQGELLLLQQRWKEVLTGEGQVVFLSGVPGVGKSRIVHELQEWIGKEPHLSVKLQCLPHCSQSSLFPVIKQLERLAEFRAEDSVDAKISKLARFLAQTRTDVPSTMALLSPMLSLPIRTPLGPKKTNPQEVKLQTLLALVEILFASTEGRPVFCVIEDAQWIDPTTDELIQLVASRADRKRILLVVTHRPECEPRIRQDANVTALGLRRLTRRQVEEMTRLVLREYNASPSVINRIVEESDCIPLFVEELARGVYGSNSQHGVKVPDPRAEPTAPWSVPDSLRNSLVARLDRSPQGKRVAQTAAVLGREFSYDLLRKVSELSPSQLDSALAHLEESEIIQQIDPEPSARYMFRHALVRDAAYESLLKSVRKTVHAKVAAILEKSAPHITSAQPELLAYHFSLAGDLGAALRYWIEGGQKAKSRWANQEAMAQFRKALECLESLPQKDRDVQELELQLSLGQCLVALDGYFAEDTRIAFQRARELSTKLKLAHQEIQALFGLCAHYWMTAAHDRAVELGEELLIRARHTGVQAELSVAHRALGSTLFSLGDFVRARTHLDEAISLAKKTPSDNAVLSNYAADPRIAAQLMLAWNLWILGYPDQAKEDALESLKLAIASSNPYNQAFAHYVLSAVYLLRGEPQGALNHAEESLKLSREHHIKLYDKYSQFGRGCALARLGRREEALVEIQTGIDQARQSNLGYMRGFMLGWLAMVQAEVGDAEGALATVNDALKNVNDITGRAWEAELFRLRGLVLEASGGTSDEAEACFRQAINVAKIQEAKSLELRAATSLAYSLRQRGQTEEAREFMADTLTWFSEGFDTADLREAKEVWSLLAC